MMMERLRPVKVLYILEIFPEISETFILYEMLGVRQEGADIRIVSLVRPNPGQQHKEAGPMLPLTTYLPDVPLHKQYLALGKIFLKFPRKMIHFTKYLYGIEKYCRDTRNRLLQVCYLCDLALKEQVDCIHAHFANPATSLAMWINMLTDIPFIFASHGYDIYYAFPSDMRLKTELAQKHLTVSRQAAGYIREKIGSFDEKIETFYSGIDVDFFSFNSSAERGNLLLNVARLHPVKGQEYLLRACRLLKNQGLDFRCVIIGEGDERPKLEQLICELDLESTCLLLGAKTREEILPFYHHAKIFVLTSISEGLGNVLKESLACGLPTVASRVGGIPEIVIEGETGYLFEVGDVAELAEKILLLWNAPEKREQFARNGRRLIEEAFDYRRQAKRLVALWKDVRQTQRQGMG